MMGSEIEPYPSTLFCAEEKIMDAGIPTEEWRENWVRGYPRYQCVYITWAQILQYHPDEVDELAEYFALRGEISVEGEQTACFRTLEYTVWQQIREENINAGNHNGNSVSA